MLVIRWYSLGPELLPCYPGTPPPEGAQMLGITVATEEAIRLMGDLLVLWRDDLLASAWDPAPARVKVSLVLSLVVCGAGGAPGGSASASC